MARASNIYIVRRKRDKGLIGSWTVKHEMVTWLKRCDMPRRSIEIAWELVRMRDGHPTDGLIHVPWEKIPHE